MGPERGKQSTANWPISVSRPSWPILVQRYWYSVVLVKGSCHVLVFKSVFDLFSEPSLGG